MEPESGFPVKTFCINIIGAFVIGLVVALGAKNNWNPKLILFLKVGICGGFTTFSSFALETDQLLAKGQTGTALLYVAMSVIFGAAAVFAMAVTIWEAVPWMLFMSHISMAKRNCGS